MCLGLFQEALDLSDAHEGARFSLKLGWEKVCRVHLDAFDGETLPAAPFPRDTHGRIRLPDGSANAFEAGPGGILEEERAPDEADDLSDPGEPVREDEVVSSDEDDYKGGDLVDRMDPVRRCAR
jgi:hypothetical protein